MFAALRFEPCETATCEDGFETVAIYGNASFYTYAARQLSSGKWTSKLGRAEDIEHDSPADITGGVYGKIKAFMRRAIAQ